MEEFSATYNLTKSEYAKILLNAVYKKPLMIVITLSGLYLMADWYTFKESDEFFYVKLIVGICLLLIPPVRILSYLQKIKASKIIETDVILTFNEDFIRFQARSYKTEISWDYFLSFRETTNYLVLNVNKTDGYYLRKKIFTAEQRKFIKSQILAVKSKSA